MKAAPRVSIVLPFRNAADTIASAIKSLQDQTLSTFECILVDHCSTDATQAVAQAACRNDARFTFARAEGTFVDALNIGCAAAQCALIGRLDADDLAAPGRLEAQYALLARDPTVALASCLVEAFPANAVREGMQRYLAWSNRLRSPEQIRASLFVESPLVHPSVVMRRAAFTRVGGYADTEGPEDYDLWLRLMLCDESFRAEKVQEVLLLWRESPQRLTRTDPHYTQARIFETKLRYLPRVVARGSSLQICGAGPIGKRWARALHDQGYTVGRFIDVDPRKQRNGIGDIAVDPPERMDRGNGFILGAVGLPGAREEMEMYFAQRGWHPWTDYLMVA